MIRNLTRLLAAALVLALATPASLGAADSFRLGVRSDARPFVYRDPVDGAYSGFLFDLCRSAIVFAGLEEGAIELVPVNAGNRFERMDDPVAPLDLLCDPTTITMERASQYDFTQIVYFASSGSLARNRPVLLPAAEAPAGCNPSSASRVVLVGWVENTTSDVTVEELAAQVPSGRGEVAVCAVPFPGHDEGVRALCAGDHRLSFYIGDGDILAAHVDALRREGLRCPAAFNMRNQRPEPYALILGHRDSERNMRIRVGIYAFFTSGEADRSFAAHFGDRGRTPVLDALFTLYQLP